MTKIGPTSACSVPRDRSLVSPVPVPPAEGVIQNTDHYTPATAKIQHDDGTYTKDGVLWAQWRGDGSDKYNRLPGGRMGPEVKLMFFKE